MVGLSIKNENCYITQESYSNKNSIQENIKKAKKQKKTLKTLKIVWKNTLDTDLMKVNAFWWTINHPELPN